jgi:hypothetical protein
VGEGDDRPEGELEPGAQAFLRIRGDDHERRSAEETRSVPSSREDQSGACAERTAGRSRHRGLRFDEGDISGDEEKGDPLTEPRRRPTRRCEQRDGSGKHREIEAGDGDEVREPGLGESPFDLAVAEGIAAEEHRL